MAVRKILTVNFSSVEIWLDVSSREVQEKMQAQLVVSMILKFIIKLYFAPIITRNFTFRNRKEQMLPFF